LIVDQPEFDFGYVPRDARISHVFWLKSVGDGVVRITKVLPGCGCTKAPVDKTELAAGDSTRLEVTFNTRGYRNRVTKSPKIVTSEGREQTALRFTAHVVPESGKTHPIVVSPFVIDLGSSEPRASDWIAFTIANVSESDLEIALIERPEGCFDLELPRRVQAGGKAVGRLKLDDESSERSFEKSITIELNDELRTRFTIPVIRSLTGPGRASKGRAAGNPE
jgi:hypothetical protein